jgi:hypothetical protein
VSPCTAGDAVTDAEVDGVDATRPEEVELHRNPRDRGDGPLSGGVIPPGGRV